MTEYLNSADGTVDGAFTTATQADLLKQYYVMTLVSNMYKNLVIMPLGKIVPMPKQTGTTINFSRLNKISASLTELAEGDSGSSITTSSSRISASLVTLGQFTTIGTRLVMTALDPILEDYANEFGKAAADSVDLYCYSKLFKDNATSNVATENDLFYEDNENDYLLGGDVTAATLEHAYLPCNYVYNDGTTPATVAALVTAIAADTISVLKSKNEWGLNINKLNSILRRFEEASVPTFDDGLYRLAVHPKVAETLRVLPEFKDIEKYQDVLNPLTGEVGQILRFRVLVTSQIAVWDDMSTGQDMADGVALAYNLALGKDSFAVSEIDGQPEMIIKTAKGDTSDKKDALNRQSTVGYGWDGAATVIAPDKGMIVVCPVTE